MQFLSGYKTYIVAAVTMLYAIVMYWASAHTPADLNTLLLTIAGALGAGSLRAALDQVLVAIGVGMPSGQRTPAIKRAMRRAGHFMPIILACVVAAPMLARCATGFDIGGVGTTIGGWLGGQGTNIERGLIAAKGLQGGWIAVCINNVGPRPGLCATNANTAHTWSKKLKDGAHCAVAAYEGNGAGLVQCLSDFGLALQGFAPLTQDARMARAVQMHSAFDVGTAIQVLQVLIQVGTTLADEIRAASSPTSAQLHELLDTIDQQDATIQAH